MNLRKEQEGIFKALEDLNKDLKVSVVSAPDNFEEDDRLCLTMVYFLPDRIKERIINEVIKPLNAADPSQYYYPSDSLHITIQNVRVISNPVNFTKEDIKSICQLSDYIKDKRLSFDAKGIFKMPGSLGIKCYPNKETQEFIIDLRRKLEEISVPDDKKYANQEVIIGNITVCRFYKKPNKDFVKILEKIDSIDLSKLEADKISLISTNSVCCKDKTEIIKTFYL